MPCKHLRIRVLQVREQIIIDTEAEIVVVCSRCKKMLKDIERIG